MTGSLPPSGGVPPSDRMALLFQELLTAVVRVRAGRQQVPSAEAFRSQVLDALRAAEEEARRKGYSGEDARLAVYAIVAFLDETVLNSGNPAFRDWPRAPLGADLFKAHIAGETFFQNARDLLMADDSHRTADLLEVYQLCLLLGYRGRYSAGREGDLHSVEDRIAEKIHRIRGASGPLAPAGLPPRDMAPRDADPWSRRLLFVAAGAALLAMVLWLTYRLTLSSEVRGLHPLALLLPSPGFWGLGG